MAQELYKLPNQEKQLTEDDVREIVGSMQRTQRERQVVAAAGIESENFVKNSKGWKLSFDRAEINTGTFGLGGTLKTVSNISELQSTIDELEDLGGGTAALVPATYNATSSFTIPSGVTLDMSGSTIDFGNGAYQILIEGTNAYSTGTLAVNFGSGSVTGTGTTWTAAMVGRSILIGDYWYEITARASNTAITISPVFRAPNVTGATYVIATTVDDVAILNGTLQNASGTLLKFRYVNGIVIDGLITTDAAQGIDGDDSANFQYSNSQVDTCTSGMTLDNVPYLSLENFGILDITGGTGLALTNTPNSALGAISIQNVTGVGVKFTSCFNLGLINYSIIECTSHGIEFVSGNRDIDIESGYTDTVGGDAIKLTATSDNINIDAQSLYNYTGYGINIAAATCDSTKVGLIAYGGGGSGTINDAGTGTKIVGDDTAYDATTWNGNLGTPTKNAVRDKIETLTGGETSALVSDTAYASSWNGVTTIAPSKNAVYDKIETLATSAKTLIPFPQNPLNDPSVAGFAMVTNTLGHLGQVVVPFGMTVNKLTVRTGTVTTPGDFDIVLYSEDGQTQVISVTVTASTSATLYSATVSSVALSAGVYYVFVVPNGTMNAELMAWNLENDAPFSTTEGIHEDVTSEPILRGTLTVTAGTPPATFDPTAITSSATNDIIIIRLDN